MGCNSEVEYSAVNRKARYRNSPSQQKLKDKGMKHINIPFFKHLLSLVGEYLVYIQKVTVRFS